jgi:hypothetical protein
MSDWWPGEQPVFARNFEKAKRLLEWQPRVGASDGVGQHICWVHDKNAVQLAKVTDREWEKATCQSNLCRGGFVES